MVQPHTIGIVRRKPISHGGGRPVHRAFHFVFIADSKYPSDSPAALKDRVPDDPDRQASWLWALGKCAAEDLWLAIPTIGDTIEQQRYDRDIIRTSVFRSGRRKGIALTSEWVDDILYVTIARS